MGSATNKVPFALTILTLRWIRFPLLCYQNIFYFSGNKCIYINFIMILLDAKEFTIEQMGWANSGAKPKTESSGKSWPLGMRVYRAGVDSVQRSG